MKPKEEHVPLEDVELTPAEEELFTEEFLQESVEKTMTEVKKHIKDNE